MNKYYYLAFALFFAFNMYGLCDDYQPDISGELKKWHKVTITFDGPEASETANPNPFLYYRLNVTFTKEDKSYTVPGYFAADGNAAETSADQGNKWRVHFAPDETGKWNYSVSFRKGKNIAVSNDPNAGGSAGFMDGVSGSFDIAPTNKTGRDNRTKGRLQYIGERYLRFAETGEYFLKAGADAPENLLAYADFDGTFNDDGHKDQFIKTWEPHIKDWKPGDPVWQNGKGKGLIGAINYLASKGMNVFSFLTLNIKGDDQNVFPYITYDNYERMDVSKLDQWEIVFEHGDRLGMFLHFKTQEAENQNLLDGGDVGVQRKLYYRELIARFGHHLALNWNLGEENGGWGNHKGQSTEQRIAMTEYFYDHDPYRHLVVIHNGQPFDDLLGDKSKLTGVSVQTSKPDFSQVHGAILRWIERSKKAGKQWAVAIDEPGDAQHALVTDEEDPTHDNARKNALWGALLAGGWGVEWYFGYQHPNSDLTCEDWRSRENMWDQCLYALQFFKEYNIPFWEMDSMDHRISNKNDYCFGKQGEIYLVYLKNGGTTNIDAGKSDTEYTVSWWNPRTGGPLQQGSIKSVSGPGKKSLGTPPSDPNKDWLVMCRVDSKQSVSSRVGSKRSVAHQELISEEHNGLVAVEAEHFTEQSKTEKRKWYKTSPQQTPHIKPDGDDNHAETASGNAYLEILPDSRRTHGDKLIQGENFTNKPGQMAILVYPVHFNTPGRYYVWVRAYSTGSEDNGLHVGIDGEWPESGQRLQWCEGKNSWWWESKQRTAENHCGEPHKIYLDVNEPGLHHIMFSMREDGFEFDKWLMTQDREFKRPEGAGPAERVKK